MKAGSLLRLVASNFGVIAGPLVTLVYPLYASVAAIETKSLVDDRQWLTYWVLYSLMTLFELTFAKFIEWLPFWTYAKLSFNLWLVLPYFNGAAYIYEQFVRPLVLNHWAIICYIPPKKDANSKPGDVLITAEKFTVGNEPEALEEPISKAGSMPKSKKSSKRVTFTGIEAEKESKSWKKFVKFGKPSANKELKPSTCGGNVTYHRMHDDGESTSWSNNSLMIFDDSRYWNYNF